jgi:NAD(P)-dependent dehydrogenase (short-subunit alcohol dehydrogenase family)
MMLEGKKNHRHRRRQRHRPGDGGAGGIGRATAVLAAREGADVTVADIDRAKAAETPRLVEAEGRAAIVIEMDTSKAADAQRMADEAVAAFGTIDGIVCCAIKLQPSKLEDLTEEAWDAVIDVGVRALRS